MVMISIMVMQISIMVMQISIRFEISIMVMQKPLVFHEFRVFKWFLIVFECSSRIFNIHSVIKNRRRLTH